nr:TaqI-like C-terminal specificity domain-containing protein [Mucilaginibacter sp. FT3.2]MBB6235304.1 hypothetical protein [Mucilaginibacter sp. FT3.2]
MSVYVRQNINVTNNLSSKNSWIISNEIAAKIKAKIEAVGIPLAKWDIQINYGIKTGYNEAFIIDQAKRDELLRISPESDQIIRPILRGRDIKKYLLNDEKLFLLFIPWHFPLHNDNTEKGVSQKAEALFKSEYPAVYDHLLKFKSQLELRNKAETGIRYEWYALQRFGSNYWEEFDKPKIIYPNMTKFLPFYYDTNGFYTNQKCFVITGFHIEYLTAFLNSSIFKFCFRENFPELQGGTRELSKVFFDLIPVKQIDDEINNVFKKKVDQVQFLKRQGIETISVEKEIDSILFDLYELTIEEREAIGFFEI